MSMKVNPERRLRAIKLVRALKKEYPFPKSELVHQTPFQFVVAVMLSAQCTDKLVNKVTEKLFRKYKTAADFAVLKPQELATQIASVSFFRNKAKAVVGTAHIIATRYKGRVPRDENALQECPGIGYKTAHVIVGELFDHWPGIPTDTHVKRFARKFDLTDNTDLKKISKDLEALIPQKDWKYVNNGLVLYGRYICKARKHDCSDHLLTKAWPPAGNRWPRT